MLTASIGYCQLVCFPECLLMTINSWILTWCNWRALMCQWESDIAPIVTTWVYACIGLAVKYWPVWVHVNVISTVKVTLNSAICVVSHFFVSPFATTHHAAMPYHPPTIYTDPILLHSLRSSTTGKISHYLFVRLVVQKLLASYIARQLSFVLLTK